MESTWNRWSKVKYTGKEMILGEDFAVSQIDQQLMWSGGGFTEVMALAGSWCEHV